MNWSDKNNMNRIISPKQILGEKSKSILADNIIFVRHPQHVSTESVFMR